SQAGSLTVPARAAVPAMMSVDASPAPATAGLAALDISVLFTQFVCIGFHHVAVLVQRGRGEGRRPRCPRERHGPLEAAVASHCGVLIFMDHVFRQYLWEVEHIFHA